MLIQYIAYAIDEVSALYGANTGIRGQIWDDPTYSIHAVPNTNLVSTIGSRRRDCHHRAICLFVDRLPSIPSRCHQGWVHFVGFKSTVSAGSYAVVEVSFKVNGINYLPGTIAWYPKDVSVGFFTDTNPSNYYAVIGKSYSPWGARGCVFSLPPAV